MLQRLQRAILASTRRLLRRGLMLLAKFSPSDGASGAERTDANARKVREAQAKLALLEPSDDGERSYLRQHAARIAETIAMTERVAQCGVALELGSYLHMAWLLEDGLGYGRVHCAGFGKLGSRVTKHLLLHEGHRYVKDVDLFDVERDPFPYEEGSVDLVLACEIIEHLRCDPLHMLREIYRVLRTGGVLILTTPNCSSLTSLANILYQVSNPYVYSAYPPLASAEAGHVREFVPCEIRTLLQHAGFEIEEEFTRFLEGSRSEHLAVRTMLAAWDLPVELRGELYFAAARKSSRRPTDGYPSKIYDAAI